MTMNPNLILVTSDDVRAAESIRRCLVTIWANLEAKPINGHSTALNYPGQTGDAQRVFACACPDTELIQREVSTWRSLEPIYKWHQWKWGSSPISFPLVALFMEGATARGVRNRKAIIREIEIACVDALDVESVNLPSIGGGAAPAIREMMEVATKTEMLLCWIEM